MSAVARSVAVWAPISVDEIAALRGGDDSPTSSNSPNAAAEEGSLSSRCLLWYRGLARAVDGVARVASEVDAEDSEVPDRDREEGADLVCFDESVGLDVVLGWAPEVPGFHRRGSDAATPH